MTEERIDHTTRDDALSTLCPTCGRTLLPPATTCPVCNARPEHAATGATRRLHPLPLRVPITTWRGWVAVAALVGAAIAFVSQAPGEIRSATDPRILVWLGALAIVLGATALARRRALVLTATHLVEHGLVGATAHPIERIAGVSLRNSPGQYSVARSLVFWDREDRTFLVLAMDYYRERDVAQMIDTLLIHHPGIVIEHELRLLLRLPASVEIAMSDRQPQP